MKNNILNKISVLTAALCVTAVMTGCGEESNISVDVSVTESITEPAAETEAVTSVTEITAAETVTSTVTEAVTEAAAVSEPGWGRVITSDSTLNVRSGPGKDYQVINSVSSGEVVQILEKVGDWYRIKLNNSTAGDNVDRYVSAEFIELTDGNVHEDTRPVQNTESSWYEIYSSLISETVSASGKNPEYIFIDLADIDSDGIPELGISTDVAHVSSCAVYTVSGNQAVKLGDFGTWGNCSYLLNQSIIVSAGANNGSCNIKFYKVENHNAVKLDTFYERVVPPGPDGDVWTEYQVNDNTVSESEFKEAKNKYSGTEMPFGTKYPAYTDLRSISW